MHHPTLAIIPVIALLATACVRPASAQSEDEQKMLFQRWLKYYQHVADGYDIRLASAPDKKLKVTPKPVMSYSHPSGIEGTHGAIFLWTRLGCPQVVASVWSHDINDGTRTVMHEFHSLARGPLVPLLIGRERWSPASGIEAEPIPGAPAPRDSAALRLAQMRSLAQEFTGFSSLDIEPVRLRTLRQPLFRYESEDPDVLDGALFGMFNEWDPEIMLLIEARKADEEFVWHFAAARFNACPMRLLHEETEVWRIDLAPVNIPAIGDRKSTFFAVHHVDRPRADLTDRLRD